jgi:hypothetical protein
MTNNFEDTDFWKLLMRDIYGPREGGVIIVIDAENARKGVAKTSAAVALADRLAYEFDYDLDGDDGCLSANELIDRYREHPGEEQPSVLVWDEAVGAGGGDARRSMSSDNLLLSRAWQILRSRRVVTITTLPNWGDLDSRLQRFADYRLWCREWPIGEFQAYKTGTDFEGDRTETKGLPLDERGAEPISFPDASADFDMVGDAETGEHPLYASLTEKKRRLQASQNFDADDLVADDANAAADGGLDPDERVDKAERDQQLKTALRAVKPWSDDDGLSYRNAAELIDYSYSWVRERVSEWERGEHRDLVTTPPSGDSDTGDGVV